MAGLGRRDRLRLTSNVSAGASQISCASASLCVAAGADETAIFDGSSWTAPAPMPGGNAAIQSVSCAKSTTFCMATDINGSAYSYDSSGWSMATHFDTSTDPLPEVSCAAPKFCVAVDGAGVDSSGALSPTRGRGVPPRRLAPAPA